MDSARKATVTYTGDGVQLKYSFPFDYLRKAFVKVQNIAGDDIKDLVLGTDYSVDDKQVTLTTPIASGNHLKIYRSTTTEPLVEWQDASVLRSADLSLQEIQLLHLSEETLDRVQEGGLSTDPQDSDVWDARFKRMKNLLDPKEVGDAVTLRYLNNNRDGIIGAITATGDTQVKRVTTTGDTQEARVVSTGNTYVETMTGLKDVATTKAHEAADSAELSKSWAISEASPDGIGMSSRSWAEASKIYASNAKTSETNAKTSETNAKSSETNANSYMTNANAYMTNASDSATKAKASEDSAKVSETNAANSAKAADASAKAAATYDPSTKQDKLTFDTTPTAGSANPVTSDGIKKALDNSGVLPGTIIAFSGAFSDDGYPINSKTSTTDMGWHLCDGTNGTPDLRGRFILGASASHSVGTTGGEEDTGLSIANLPPHSFSGTTSRAGSHQHRFWGVWDNVDDRTTRYENTNDYSRTRAWGKVNYVDAEGEHDHTFTTNTLGSGVKHNNMPPFYTLAFIMKL